MQVWRNNGTLWVIIHIISSVNFACGGRRDRLPLPQCPASTALVVLYAMLGYYNFICIMRENNSVKIVKWTLVSACGLRNG